jgi:hypothetical protein
MVGFLCIFGIGIDFVPALRKKILYRVDMNQVESSEKYLGIKRINDYIYLYGDASWADADGIVCGDNCEIVVKLIAGKFLPSIYTRSIAENMLTYVYTPQKKQEIAASQKWYEAFDVDAQRVFYINKENSVVRQYETPAENEYAKYIVGRPKFVQKEPWVQKLNYDNALLQKQHYDTHPEEFAVYPKEWRDYYQTFLDTQVQHTKKVQPSPLAEPVPKNVSTNRYTRKNGKVHDAYGSRNDGKLYDGVKNGYPAWYVQGDRTKLTFREPDSLRRVLDSGGWVQAIDPKNPDKPVWIITIMDKEGKPQRTKRNNPIPKEFADAIGFVPKPGPLKTLRNRPSPVYASPSDPAPPLMTPNLVETPTESKGMFSWFSKPKPSPGTRRNQSANSLHAVETEMAQIYAELHDLETVDLPLVTMELDQAKQNLQDFHQALASATKELTSGVRKNQGWQKPASSLTSDVLQQLGLSAEPTIDVVEELQKSQSDLHKRIETLRATLATMRKKRVGLAETLRASTKANLRVVQKVAKQGAPVGRANPLSPELRQGLYQRIGQEPGSRRPLTVNNNSSSQGSLSGTRGAPYAYP